MVRRLSLRRSGRLQPLERRSTISDSDCGVARYLLGQHLFQRRAPKPLVESAGHARLMRQRLLADDRGREPWTPPLDLSACPSADVATRAGAVWSLLLPGRLPHDRRCGPAEFECRPGASACACRTCEISEVYRNDIVGRFTRPGRRHAAASSDLHRALVDGDACLLAEELEDVLLNSASFYDLTSENSYHMLLVGLLFGVPGYGNPASNREAGRGRFDIRLAPERAGLPAVTLELKFEHGADASRLQVLATEALAQIEARAYDADTARGGAGAPSTAGSLRYGIAFSGKSLAVAVGAQAFIGHDVSESSRCHSAVVFGRLFLCRCIPSKVPYAQFRPLTDGTERPARCDERTSSCVLVSAPVQGGSAFFAGAAVGRTVLSRECGDAGTARSREHVRRK